VACRRELNWTLLKPVLYMQMPSQDANSTTKAHKTVTQSKVIHGPNSFLSNHVRASPATVSFDFVGTSHSIAISTKPKRNRPPKSNIRLAHISKFNNSLSDSEKEDSCIARLDCKGGDICNHFGTSFENDENGKT
jgi:hypothetical protein